MRSVSWALVALVTSTGLASAEDNEPSDVNFNSATTGAFLPFGDTPAATGSIATVLGVYDGARDRSAVTFKPVANLTSWLQIEGALTYSPDATESIDREVSAQFNLLREDTSGFDVQLGGGWDSAGINDVSAAFATLAAGRHLMGTYVLGAARFDLGTDGEERGLEFALGSARPISMNLFAGIDTQLRLDLERDAMESQRESSWQLTSGPYVGYAISHFAVIGSVGVAADKPRMESREVGVFGAVGVGAAF